MADQVGVMESGRIHQWATSYELYHRPQTRFVADFIGQGEFLGATVVDEFAVESALGLHRSSKHHGYDREQRVDVLIRPDDVLHDDDSELTGEIISKRFRGSHFLYSVRLQSHERVYCLADSHHNHAIGERIGITLNLDHLVMFPKERTL